MVVTSDTPIGNNDLMILHELTEEQQEAYMIVRDQTKDATSRLLKARLLPDDALLAIGNVVAKTVYNARHA